MKKFRTKTQYIAFLAVMIAIIVVMAFTPLGYVKLGLLSITLLSVPVAVGAIFGGVLAGGILGLVFGLTSLCQCFGLEAFGTSLFGINPVFTIILCIVPRVLMGIFTALLYKLLSKGIKNNFVLYGLTALVGSLINTILLISCLLLFFYNTELLQSFGTNIFEIIVALVSFNGIIEWSISFVIGGLLSNSISSILKIK